MVVIANLKTIEQIYRNTDIMSSNEIIELYLIETRPINRDKFIDKMGLILYRSQYHLISVSLQSDVGIIINSVIDKTKDKLIYNFLRNKKEKSILKFTPEEIKENLDIEGKENSEKEEINKEIEFKNLSRTEKKTAIVEDFRNGMCITKLIQKYKTSSQTIKKYIKEFENPQEDKYNFGLGKKERKKRILMDIQEGYSDEELKEKWNSADTTINKYRDEIGVPDPKLKGLTRELKNLIETSEKFEIDVRKVKEENENFFYVDFGWNQVIQNILEGSNIHYQDNKIWMIENIFKELIQNQVQPILLEASLRKNDIFLGSTVMNRIYEFYCECVKDYKKKLEIKRLYQGE